MGNSPPTLFPRIRIKQVSLEAHSRLYHLEPVGIDTPLVESLTSYICRLAKAHCFRVSTLIAHELYPHLDMPYLFANLEGYSRVTGFASQRVKNAIESVNGIAISTVRFVSALEHLTKRRNLRNLTLLSWADVLTPRNLLRKFRAWCPDCLKEWHTNGQPVYEPLLWVIEAVKMCPRHQQYLISTCPSCGDKSLLLRAMSRAGYCPSCESWLGRSSVYDSISSKTIDKAELHFQTWAAENVGQILSSVTTIASMPLQDNLGKSMTAIINYTYEGIGQRLAKAIGKSKSTIWGWQHGMNKPSMGEMLTLCYVSGISLLEFLTAEGRIKSGQFMKQPYSKKSIKIIKAPPRKLLNSSAVKDALTRCLDPGSQPISMVEAAGQIGLGVKTLRKNFPKLCKQISLRFLKHKKEVRERAQRDFFNEANSAIFRLQSSGQEITRRNIAILLNKPKYVNNLNLLPLIRKAKLNLPMP